MSADRVRRRPGDRRCRALRGLRPVPVPRLGPQEPAALAVRRARAAAPGRSSTTPSGRRCAPSASSIPGAHRGCTSACAACRSSTAASRRRSTVVDSARRSRSSVDDATWVEWDEAVEHELTIAELDLLPTADAGREVPVHLPAGATSTSSRRRPASVAGRAVRTRQAVDGRRARRDALGRRPRGVPRGRRHRRERHRLVRSGRDARRRRPPLARRRAHLARRRRRHVRVAARATGRRRPGSRRLPQRRHLPGARRTARRRRAVVADHPLRPAGDRPGERRRPLRRHRDRRDPRPAGAHPHRRGEGGGQGDRRPGGRDRRPLRRPPAGGLGATARRGPLDRPDRRCRARADAVVGPRRRRGDRPVDRVGA